MSKLTKIIEQHKRSQKARSYSRFYNLNSMLGNNWAMFFVIIGSRMTGKSYSVTDFLCRQKKKYKDNCKNYWMRISETSTNAMLANKCKGLVDPDLVKKYDLDLTHKDMYVFDHGKDFMTVMPLSKFGKLKGVAFYDKDYTGYINIVLDEFQLEQNEKRTSFDILYNFIGSIENIARTTKQKIKIFLLGNTLQEAATILKAFNFIPHQFGRFYLKSKKCVIDNMEPTDEYLKDRSGSAVDILGGNEMSNYTNAITKDLSLIYTGRVNKPKYLIKFSKKKKSWYVVWDNNVIKRYKRQTIKSSCIIAMRPYLENFYSKERVVGVIDKYDARCYKFDSLITQAYFEDDLQMLRK